MLRRCRLALGRCAIVVALGWVGLPLALAAPVAGFFPHTFVRAVRRLAMLGRRLAERWGGVVVEADYQPAPPAPVRRPDGWYSFDNQLYRSPRVPARLARWKWLGSDPANRRDWLWLFLTPLAGGLAALVPITLIVAGPAVLLVRPLWWVVGVGLAVVGVGVAPAMVRVHARWTRVLLQPVGSSWWFRSGLGPRLADANRAGWHLAELSVLSLAAFGLFVGQVVAVVGSFGALAAPVVALGRPLVEVYRRRARLGGIDVPSPYRPYPTPPEPSPDGQFRGGRSLYRDRAAWLAAQRVPWVLGDPATWRDLAWAGLAPVLALPTLVPAGLVCAGFYGLVCQPVWWAPWAVPLGLSTGAWVTPWYLWYLLSWAVPGLSVVPGWFSPVIGLGLAAVGVAVAGVLRPVRSWWDRRLLGPDRTAVLAQRVRSLTESRSDAADAQASELRRIERDLHDGAQARMVAVGLSLATVDRLLDTDPAAARALLAQAREASATALTELRSLVRGIHPPVLAERGLGDAIRAIALDSPSPVVVTVDLPGRVEAPVEAAAYFAACEAIANAARHSRAAQVTVSVSYRHQQLRIVVADDGVGGADPARGTGLSGLRRRLSTFDGVLALSSPAGGPTVVTMEIPCALS